MSHAERLDKASTAFFFAGFVVSKLHHTPFVVLATLSNIGSLFLYTLAYGLWFLASRLYPDYPRKAQSWYGFTEFKNQHRIAVVLGVAAIVSCLAAITMPLAIIPATWLFAFSNSVWCISEYHKKQNPPTDDREYSSSLQTTYFRYAVTTVAMSFLTALDTTIVIFFPTAAVLTLTFSSVAGVGLGALSLYYLTDYIYQKHTPDALNASYIQMIDPFDLTSGKSPQDRPQASPQEVAHHRPVLGATVPVVSSTPDNSEALAPDDLQTQSFV